jgi:hypothetical protein
VRDVGVPERLHPGTLDLETVIARVHQIRDADHRAHVVERAAGDDHELGVAARGAGGERFAHPR